jgi:phosphate transport system protein
MISTQHTVRSYDEELTRLITLTTQMGQKVVTQLDKVCQALLKRDNAIAAEAFESDNEIDDIEQSIHDLGLRLLALRQPMASDLRLIVGCMKSCRDLERIGDYAANLAKRSRLLNRTEKMPITSSLLHMAGMLVPILRKVMDAFVNNDTIRADEVYRQDDEVDAAYDALIEATIKLMQQDTASIQIATHILFMAKNMERIGDRITNIAETVHFIASGKVPGTKRRRVVIGDEFKQLDRDALPPAGA